MAAAIKIIVSTPSSAYAWAPNHTLLRNHLLGFLGRRGIVFKDQEIRFVEGGDYQTSLVLESTPDAYREALATCLGQWNALLCSDSEFVDTLPDWSERDARETVDGGECNDSSSEQRIAGNRV